MTKSGLNQYNPHPDMVAVHLHLLAMSLGHDYVKALIASSQTAAEVLDYTAEELAERMLARCAE